MDWGSGRDRHKWTNLNILHIQEKEFAKWLDNEVSDLSECQLSGW